MKKLRQIIERYLLDAEQKWIALPKKRQRLMTKAFFAGYTLLTIAAFIQIWWSAANGKAIPIGGHISNIPAGIDNTPKSPK